jgi:hypothetical protein
VDQRREVSRREDNDRWPGKKDNAKKERKAIEKNKEKNLKNNKKELKKEKEKRRALWTFHTLHS